MSKASRQNEQRVEKQKARLIGHKYEEDWDSPYFLHNLLKRILLLPWDTAWNLLLLITGVILISGYSRCLMVLQNDEKCWQITFFTVLEYIWVVDILITIITTVIGRVSKEQAEKIQMPMQNFGNRPIWLIATEVLSVVPVSKIAAALGAIPHVVILLKLMRGNLKVIRIIYTMRFKLCSLSYNIYTLLGYVLVLKIFISLIVVYFITIYCIVNKQELDHANLLYVIVSLMNSAGSSDRPRFVPFWPLVSLLVLLPTYWFVSMYLGMASTTLFLMIRYHGESVFLWAREATMANLAHLRIKLKCDLEIEQYWNILWGVGDGDVGLIADTSVPYLPPLLMSHLPPAMAKGISADIGFQALKHSSLFKTMNLPFLREVSARFQQRYFLAGQYIFHRKELKDTLIYVSQGTIQLLSQEDAETPILSLTAGSVICETTVIFPSKSVVNVKCQTDCQVQLLRRSELKSLAGDFRHSYSKLVQRILNRMIVARRMKVMEDEMRIRHYPTTRTSMVVMWMTRTIHSLLKMEFSKTAGDYIYENIYLESDMDESCYKKLLFNADYINMLCLKRHVFHDDAVFVRLKGWFFILQPDCFLAYIWEGLIILVATATAMLMPYAVLVSNVGEEPLYKSMFIFITFIWIADLFVRVKISVKTKFGKLDTTMDILTYHLTNPSYYFDIFCALPMYAITAIIFVNEDIRDIFSLNRVFKAWRLASALNKIGNRSSSNSLKIHIFIILTLFIYVIYFVACVLYALQQYEDTKEFYKLLFAATQSLTGHALTSNMDMQALLMNLVLLFTAWYIHTILFMLNLVRGMLYSQVKRITHHKLHLLSTYLKFNTQQRVHKSIDMQLKDNLGATYAHMLEPAEASFMDMPRPIKTSILYNALSERLSKYPLFKHVLGTWLLKISSVCTIQVVHGHECLLRSGDITSLIYLLIDGRCKVFNCMEEDKPHDGGYISAGSPINELEVIYGKPQYRTIVTDTSCRIAVIDYNDLTEVMQRRHLDLCIKSTVAQLDQGNDILTSANYACHKQHTCFKVETSQSYIRHNKSAVHGSLSKKIGIKSYIISHVMLNTTFAPDGVFVYRWEIIRSAGLFVSTVVFINAESIVMNAYNDRFFAIMLFFDLWTLIDIYIRFHIGYFNDKGLLISHPILTAKRYLKNAFLIDSLALIPVRHIVKFETFPNVVLCSHLVHILQLYRYWYFIQDNDISKINKTKLLRGLPLLILLIWIGSTILIHSDCDMHRQDWLNLHLICQPDSLFETNEVTKNITNKSISQTYLYAFYVVTSMLTQCNMVGFNTVIYFDVLFATICNVCGLFVRMLIFAFVALHYFGANHLHSFAVMHAASQMKRFIASQVMSQALKDDVINHFRIVRQLPVSLHEASKSLCYSLRRDILFDYFAPQVLHANFLNNVPNADVFLRNLLPHMRRQLIGPNVYFMKVNDIVSEIFLVFDGVATVRAADDRSHVTHLGIGSLMGNLSNVRHCRIQHMFQAYTLLKTYAIQTEVFYYYLNCFSEVKTAYRDMKFLTRNFIPGKKVVIEKYPVIKKEKSINILRLYTDLIIDARLPWFIYFTTVSASIIYLETLAIIVNGFKNDGFMIIIYICITILYTCNIVLLPKVDFKPISANLIHQPTTILPKHKILFWTCVVPTVPFQLFRFICEAMQVKDRTILVTTVAFRFVKLLRLIWIGLLVDLYSAIMGKNIYMCKQLINAGLYLLLLIYAMEIFLVFGFILSPNMNPPIELLERSFTEHMTFVIRWMEFSADVLTLSTEADVYPVEEIFVLICIVMMLMFSVVSVFLVVDILFTLLQSHSQKYVDAIKLMKLKRFMLSWDVNQFMQDRVLRYCHEQYLQEMDLRLPPAVLAEAPRHLQISIMDECYGQFLYIHPVFNRCHIHFLRHLAALFEPHCYYPGDYIQYQGSMESTMYFIHTGVVEELSEHRPSGCVRHRYITRAQAFGELQGLGVHVPLPHSYRASTSSLVLSLRFTSWKHLLDLFPASKVILNMQFDKWKGRYQEECVDIII